MGWKSGAKRPTRRACDRIRCSRGTRGWPPYFYFVHSYRAVPADPAIIALEADSRRHVLRGDPQGQPVCLSISPREEPGRSASRCSRTSCDREVCSPRSICSAARPCGSRAGERRRGATVFHRIVRCGARRLSFAAAMVPIRLPRRRPRRCVSAVESARQIGLIASIVAASPNPGGGRRWHPRSRGRSMRSSRSGVLADRARELQPCAIRTLVEAVWPRVSRKDRGCGRCPRWDRPRSKAGLRAAA